MAIEITSGDIFTLEQLKYHSKIYAGPGAGKTHFLVENIKNIIMTNKLISQGRSRKVLCITYTNAAVDEIKRRLDRFTEYIDVYTIHGFIIEHIIQPFQHDLKLIMESDFRIAVNGNDKISSQVEGLGILHGIDKNEIYDFIREANPEELATDDISYSKKVMGDVEVDIEAFVTSVFDGTPHQMKLKPSKVHERHVMPLKKYIWSVVRKLTHDEILYFGYRILESNPTALYAIRVKFPFVFVDEFQDTSPLQTLLIKLIGQKSTVVGVVGDVAQSIYSFQGARPTHFKNFSIEGSREIKEYAINGNRRSTENVVNFCNFIRQSDVDVIQTSMRPYLTEEDKIQSESKKIHFLLGKTDTIQSTIQNVIEDNGVVITRAWAASFDYIQGIENAQVKLLKDIYNDYYNTPIQIRDEIAEHNNVIWVRAFRFIFSLWESYCKGSLIDIIHALRLYATVDVRKLTPKVVYQIGEISERVFRDVDEASNTCEVIKRFNIEIANPEFIDFKTAVFISDFEIPLFSEFDSDKLKNAVNALVWDTSYKLFTAVFSENSKYMTVHQAKGLEWDKVIVSVIPNRFDGTKIADLYSDPRLMEEKAADEFVRMYYVACSRAKEDLYIHIPSGCSTNDIELAIEAFIMKSGKKIEYEFIN